MIFGIGVDIIEIARVEKLLAKPNINKLFSDGELQYAEEQGNAAPSLAGCFAAKEAVLKAFGSGFAGMGLRDVEVCHRKGGQPFAELHGAAAAFAAENIIAAIHLSISHDKTQAVAMAVVEIAGD